MDTPNPLRLGVVGFGKLGFVHCAISNALPNCRLVAVADKQNTVLSVLKSNWANLSTYTDHRKLISEMKLDGVFIATPTHLHVPIAMDFIQAQIPVFIEKPLSVTSAQARPLIEMLKKNPIKTMVGYMSRFCETFMLARQIIHSGALGKLQFFKSNMYIGQLFKPGKGWRYEKKISGGGVLITQNSHLIDMLHCFFGKVDWVSSHTSSFYSREVEDAAHVYLQFANGLKGWIDTSWSARHCRTLTMNIQVQGENGTLDVNDDDVKLFLDKSANDFSSGWSSWNKPKLFQPVAFDIAGPQYTRQSTQFVSSLRDNGPIDSDVLSAYHVHEILDAIYQSADNKGQQTWVGTA